jgi:hypothetical protein
MEVAINSETEILALRSTVSIIIFLVFWGVILISKTPSLLLLKATQNKNKSSTDIEEKALSKPFGFYYIRLVFSTIFLNLSFNSETYLTIEILTIKSFLASLLLIVLCISYLASASLYFASLELLHIFEVIKRNEADDDISINSRLLVFLFWTIRCLYAYITKGFWIFSFFFFFFCLWDFFIVIPYRLSEITQNYDAILFCGLGVIFCLKSTVKPLPPSLKSLFVN